MTNVLQFPPSRRRAGANGATGIGELLQLHTFKEQKVREAPLESEGASRLPVLALLIVACTALAYVMISLHVVDQKSYSARANIQPPSLFLE